MSINILTLRPWKSKKHLRVPSLWKWKNILYPILMKFKTCNPYGLRISHKKIEWNWRQKNFPDSKGFFWKSEKYQKKNFFLSPISLKFYVWDPEKKNFFLIFSHFHLMLEDPQKFSTSDFSNFLVKNVKSSFTGSWQIPKGTKSWNLVNLPLTAR